MATAAADSTAGLTANRIEALLSARLFVEHANGAALDSLMQAAKAVIEAYQSGDFLLALKTKNRFYDALFEGAVSAARR